MADVALSGLRKSYGGVEVIRSLDLTIRSGEFIVLVGPSGSGKSTLLRMIAGLEKIDAGSIQVDGADVTRSEPGDRDMAMVFQSYALYPHMTVAENMTFALRMRKTDELTVSQRLRDAVRMLALDGLEDRKPGQLSGGQRQRVAMGRAIVRQPGVFLFDEPLSNLDAKLRGRTRLELRQLHDKLAATSIFVTHDQVEAMTMADRIVLLDRGVIQQVGSPRELYERPCNRFVASFIGSPEINMLDAGLKVAEGGALSFGGLALPGTSDDRDAGISYDGPVSLGVRPESISISSESGPGTIPVTVEAVEYMGAESFAFARSELGPLAIKLPPAHLCETARPGVTLHAGIRPGGWHLFDASGRCVRHG